MLTKDKILGGIKNTKMIELPMYDDEIAVREISDLEYNKFVSEFRNIGKFDMISTMKGTRNKEDVTKMSSSMKEISSTRYNAKLNLALLALDNKDNPEKLNKKDLENLKAGSLDLIVNGALEFSGLDNIDSLQKDVDDFREEE